MSIPSIPALNFTNLFSLNLLHNILKHTSIQIAIIDNTGTIIFTNEAWDNFTLLEPNSLIILKKNNNYFNTSRKNISLEEERFITNLTELFNDICSGFFLEYKSKACDKNQINLIKANHLLKNELYIVTQEIITNDKNNFSTPINNESFLSRIIESSMDAIISVDSNQKIILFNSAAENIFGCSATQALNSTMDRFIPFHIRVKHTYQIKEFIQAIQTSPELRITKDLYGLRQNGEEFPLEASVSKIEMAGKPVLTFFLRDITDQKLTQQSIKESEERLQSVIENLHEGLVISELDGRIIYWNRAGLAMHKYERQEEGLLRKFPDLQDIFELKDLNGKILSFNEWPLSRVLHGEILKDCEAHVRRLDIPWSRIFSYSGSIIQDASGRPMAFLAISDITARKKAEEALFAEKEFARITLSSIADAVITTDAFGKITYLNRAAEQLTSCSQKYVIGKLFSEIFNIVDPNSRQSVINIFDNKYTDDKLTDAKPTYLFIRSDGNESLVENSASPIYDFSGKINGQVIVLRDVTQARKISFEMSRLAKHDFLTGMPNRVLLNDRLSRAIKWAHRHSLRLGVLFLDLDRFKHTNDSLGHSMGDKLLQSVANRLIKCVRDTDTVSRQGGDEFVVLLSEVSHSEDAALIAQKILSALASPHQIDQYDLHVSASIGISIFPDDGTTSEILLKNADTAMYHAKENGRNNFQFFKQEMMDRAIERQAIESSLRRALAENEFMLHYQPKFDLETGIITGVEALLRWQHPIRGMIPPAHFITIAEDYGLIIPIGQWVLQEVCIQAQSWLKSGLLFKRIAINISAIEFRSKDFLNSVQKIFAETKISPEYLEFELTESVLMQDAESAISMLTTLRDMGVNIAIDDFGTGYSSLSYLKQLPIDTLKIDQSFVQDIATDSNDAAIVNAIIAMGESLKYQVIAEGIESKEQLNFLKASKCAQGQGYLFSKPVNAKEFGELLKLH
ncbi:MAG: EAL domain-containing protein [Pseudomonadota bacterium]